MNFFFILGREQIQQLLIPRNFTKIRIQEWKALKQILNQMMISQLGNPKG
jgi:hypothetical protein